MDFTLLIPKKIARKEIRNGGGSDFWDNFWKEFDNKDAYTVRIQSTEKVVNDLLKIAVPDDGNIFAEVKLDENSTSKTKRPNDVWEHTNLDIVEARDDLTITVSGKKEDYKKLLTLLESGDFEKAQSGEGISRTDKNLLRELYAVSEINDKNTSIDKRIDHHIANYIASHATQAIHCLIEIYSNMNKFEYDELFDKINGEIGNNKLKKRDTKFFIHNMSYEATLTVPEIRSILSNINLSFVQIIKLYPTFAIQREIPDIDFSDITVLDPQTEEVVAVIDSGVDCPILNRMRFQQIKHLESHHTEDTNHGTFVTSRILYGDDIFSKVSNPSKTMVPVCKYLDVQVLHSDGDKTKLNNIDVLKKAIDEVISRYKQIKIFNLSIAQDFGIEEGLIDDLTEYLDFVSRENDVLFVCSAGNQTLYANEQGYENIFSDPLTIIASPSDALNVISVGSVVGKVDGNCLCTQADFPSPFTRKGGCRNDWKKPELVERGGNKLKSPNGNYNDDSYIQASNHQVGVEGLSSTKLVKGVGTSYSAPLITRQSVYLLDYINKSNMGDLINLKGNYANTIKSFLIHSTSKVNQANIQNENVKRAYGFGLPDYRKIIRNDENEVSVMYCDTIKWAERKHKITFELPSYLIGQPAEFIFTLVYNPPVNKNFPQEYKMITLNSSLSILAPTIDMTTGKQSIRADYIKPEEWNWDNYNSSNFNVTHFTAIKNKIKAPYLQILVQMTASDRFEQAFKGQEEANIFQPYSLMLTIIDKSQHNRLRKDVLATNQFQTLVENNIEIHNLV